MDKGEGKMIVEEEKEEEEGSDSDLDSDDNDGPLGRDVDAKD